MQRPIKFRCWDKINDRFGYQFNKYVVAEDGTAYSFVAFDFSGYIVSLSEALENYDYVVQESTGLLDKSGTEIYEGDIVHHNLVDWVVKWIESQAGFSPFDKINGEVIGNIYENGELLKEERTK